jgi:hypothetical protein
VSPFGFRAAIAASTPHLSQRDQWWARLNHNWVFLPQTGEIGLSWRSFPLDIIALVCQRFLVPVETMARGPSGKFEQFISLLAAR